MRNIAVVMPCSYNTMFTDDPQGHKFFELVTHEQRVICHNYFPLSSRREDNYIGGISLGAYGALKAALYHPEYYSSAIIIDGGFSNDMKNGFLKKIRSHSANNGLIPPVPLDDALPESMEMYDIAKQRAAENKVLPRFFWAWGSENPVTAKESKDGMDELKKLGFDVYAKEYAGCGRDWDFWDLALRDAIETWLPL